MPVRDVSIIRRRRYITRCWLADCVKREGHTQFKKINTFSWHTQSRVHHQIGRRRLSPLVRPLFGLSEFELLESAGFSFYGFSAHFRTAEPKGETSGQKLDGDAQTHIEKAVVLQ